jgi:predicted short-subunit dehydrogenase-like oxidoreductase (DUF2520 family)
MSLGTALVRCGHGAVGTLARSVEAASQAAQQLETEPLSWNEDLPRADLLILAVRDDAIEEVAGRLASRCRAVRFAVHLSGLKPVTDLASLSTVGLMVGVFHPLQTLPNPEDGAASLP